MKLSTYFFLMGLFLFSCSIPTEKTDIKTPQKSLSLVYISSRGEGFDLYKKSLKESQEIQLTTDPGWEWQPQWDRAHQRIVHYSQDTAGVFAIKAIDLRGNSSEFPDQGLEEFTLSPDGKWGIFTSKVADSTRLMLYPIGAMQDSVVLTQSLGYNGRVKWANMSDQVAFLSDRSGKNEIYLYTLADRKIRQLTDNTLREKYFSWSGDDQMLATTMADGDAANDIFLIQIATGAVEQITDTPLNESEIAYAPVGNLIAYHAQIGDQDDIFVLHVDTGAITQVTHGEGYHGEPIWVTE